MNKRNSKRSRGITLVALVITIIVLLILAGVTIAYLTGENGLLKRGQESAGVYNKEEATEQMNLKITKAQMASYAESKQMPTLQYLADSLCADDEMQYVTTTSKKTAALDKIEVGDATSIFAKIEKYPYEFEINNQLQLASIDGIEIASNTSELEDRIAKLEQTVALLQANSKVKLIERTYAASTTVTTPDAWTDMETVSLAGNGTGKAIISYTATNPNDATTTFQIGLYKNGTLIGFDGDYSNTSTTWIRGSTTATVSYDENTNLKFKAYSRSTSVTPYYTYSITLIPD